jgi:hypothetical protein
LAGLNMRITHRTLLVLAAIAEGVGGELVLVTARSRKTPGSPTPGRSQSSSYACNASA